MEEYIARHKDEFPVTELEHIKNSCEYGCSDPRLHPRQQEHSEQAAREAEGELKIISTRWQRYWMVMRKITSSCLTVLCFDA